MREQEENKGKLDLKNEKGMREEEQVKKENGVKNAKRGIRGEEKVKKKKMVFNE